MYGSVIEGMYEGTLVAAAEGDPLRLVECGEIASAVLVQIRRVEITMRVKLEAAA